MRCSRRSFRQPSVPKAHTMVEMSRAWNWVIALASSIRPAIAAISCALFMSSLANPHATLATCCALKSARAPSAATRWAMAVMRYSSRTSRVTNAHKAMAISVGLQVARKPGSVNRSAILYSSRWSRRPWVAKAQASRTRFELVRDVCIVGCMARDARAANSAGSRMPSMVAAHETAASPCSVKPSRKPGSNRRLWRACSNPGSCTRRIARDQMNMENSCGLSARRSSASWVTR
mmetsp:Transcript_152812/g.266990  ORF Transcript_152812/g.266990 Transcript_152812/m.266990 type:complete len:234 (+) Transcript_152812:831-1532(+)